MMLSLGNFQFSIQKAAYQDLSLSTNYPWAKLDRLMNTPTFHATGLEHRTISLKGVVYPLYQNAGTEQIETLRALASKMEPQSLVAGDGTNLGRWVILDISEDASEFLSEGQPLKQNFSLKLERFEI